MDNVETPVTQAPPQGQAPTPAETPNVDARGENPTSGDVAGATPPSEGGQEAPILGKFKSVEDLQKAYTELESHNKKVEMDKAELMKLFVEQPSAPEAPTAAAQETATDEDPMAAIRPMLRDEFGKLLSPVIAKLEVEDAVRKFGDDFVKHASQVKELKSQNPSLSLEAAYKIVAYDTLQRTAMNQGVAQAVKAQEQSQKAQLESSKPSGYRPLSLEDAIKNKNVPLQEIVEAMGPEYEAFAKITKERLGNRK